MALPPMPANLASAVLAGIFPRPGHLTTGGLLDIEKCEFIAEGRSRAVYAHPSAPDLLIKVMLPHYVEARSTRSKSILKRMTSPWRKFGPYAIFYRETRETIHATRAVHPDYSFPLPFARSYGFIWTNRGLAQVVERIGSTDGTLAPTLKQLVEEGRFTADHAAILDAFFDICMEKGIVVGTVHADNIVYQDGAQRFVCIDGFGDKNTIPIHEISRFANRLKLQRARRKLARAIRGLSSLSRHDPQQPALPIPQ
jgi:hypothetical protein